MAKKKWKKRWKERLEKLEAEWNDGNKGVTEMKIDLGEPDEGLWNKHPVITGVAPSVLDQINADIKSLWEAVKKIPDSRLDEAQWLNTLEKMDNIKKTADAALRNSAATAATISAAVEKFDRLNLFVRTNGKFGETAGEEEKK